jgi:DNA-damage-inducible protein D
MAKLTTAAQGAFDFDSSGDSHFESLAKTNGTRYWFARDLMRALGYESWPAFKKAINKATAACIAINVSVVENFIQCSSSVDGKALEDFKLSRFACCLTALNGDPKNPSIAAAQAYFIGLAEVLHDSPLDADSVDRLLVREEISEQEVALVKTAGAAGVEFFDRFQNAGYRGMYNMNYADLKRVKKIPDVRRSLLDFMGKEELAGNLFRLTLTEGRIKKDGIRGQSALEDVAHQVGRRVRKAMIEETGKAPESLPISTDIKTVKRSLKSTNRGFGGLDDVTKGKTYEAEDVEQRRMALSGVVLECPECAAGDPRSHFGSPQCTSGSLASGGTIAHCGCDYCS